MGKYNKKVTAKKALRNSLLLGVGGAGILSFVLDAILPALQSLPPVYKVGQVTVIIGILSALDNWYRHRLD